MYRHRMASVLGKPASSSHSWSVTAILSTVGFARVGRFGVFLLRHSSRG